MYKLMRRRTPLGGAIVLMIGLSAGLFFLFTAQTAPPTPAPISLSGVPEELNSDGMKLTSPPAGSVATVSQDVAEQAAISNHPGARVKETVLAWLVDSSRSPALDQLVWVVSLDPTRVTVPTNDGFVNDFALAFIDAKTGDGLFTMVQSHMPGSQPGASGAVPSPSP